MFTKSDLRQARPENVRRLAKYMKFENIDNMSIGQVIRLLDWYFKRADKKRRGLTMLQAWGW